VGVPVDQPKRARQHSALEREAELAALEERLADARAGTGGLLVIEGPAGIGKTTLLEAAVALARNHAMMALCARGAPLERDFSFGVSRALFEPLRATLAPVQWAGLTQGAAGLAGLVLDEPDPATPSGEPSDVAQAALYGLYWLVANLAASRAVLLAVDDLQWADSSSQRWLAYLAHRLEGLPVLVAVTLRTDEPASDSALLAELVACATWPPLRPAPLGEAAVAALVRDALGESATIGFCRACHETTGGNPFLLRALLASLGGEGIEPTDEAAQHLATFGPEAVARAVDRRLLRLPDGSRSLVKAVAVLGEGARLRHAAALAALDVQKAGRIADAVRAAGIFVVDRRLEFVHPIVRSAVTASMLPDERALAHARAARLLASEGVAADRLALHLLHAEPARDPWAVETLRAAARIATERGAPDAAASYLRRALEEPPPARARPGVLLELGLAAMAGFDADAPALLQAAVEQLVDPVERAGAALRAARALSVGSMLAAAASVSRAGLAGGGRIDEPTRLRLDAELIANAWHRASTSGLAWERLARESQANETARTGTSADALPLAAHAAGAAFKGATSSAVELAERAIARGILGEHGSILVSLTMLALLWSDRLAAAGRICEEQIAAGQKQGSPRLVAHFTVFRGAISYRRGAVPDAEADGRFAYEIVREAGTVEGLPWALAHLIDALIERGDCDAGEHAIANSGLVEPLPDDFGAALLIERRGRLRCAQGQIEAGLVDLREAAARSAAHGVANPNIATWRLEAALALVALGEKREAKQLADEQLELARKTGITAAVGMALRVRGVVTGELADLREAVTTLERTEARLELARALLDLGGALRRRGQRVVARAHLRRSLDLAHRCGAQALVQRAHEELRAAGGRPRRPALTGIDALTASERRVARMAAEGLANREIAQRLFVTQRTVESHLMHVFQKLGIHTRAALAPELFGNA
jgi:DNA-binding CsgD family transcriptional regulator